MLWVLLSIILIGLTRHGQWCKTGTNIMGITHHFPNVFKACSTRWNPQPALLSDQEHMTTFAIVISLSSQLLFCSIDVVLTNSIIIIIINEGISQLSQEKLLSAVDGDWYRSSLLVKVHRIRGCRMFSPKWTPMSHSLLHGSGVKDSKSVTDKSGLFNAAIFWTKLGRCHLSS